MVNLTLAVFLFAVGIRLFAGKDVTGRRKILPLGIVLYTLASGPAFAGSIYSPIAYRPCRLWVQAVLSLVAVSMKGC